MRRDRHQALVDRWVRAIRTVRWKKLGDESLAARFAKSGSFADLVDVFVEDAATHVICCESCFPPVRDPVLRPAAVIDAMLARSVSPQDALRALARTLSAAAMDALVEAIPVTERHALCEHGDPRWATHDVAIELGVPESIRGLDEIVRRDSYALQKALLDAFDPRRRSLPLRALLGSATRGWFLEWLRREENVASLQNTWTWLREPETTRLLQGLLSESSDEVRVAMRDAPMLVAIDRTDRTLDLRESYVLLCSRFGHDAFAQTQLRVLFERPATRSFDGIDVTMAPHPTTTRAVVERLTPEARIELEQWVFSLLDQRDAAANEWIALAQWCSADRAVECFTRAMAIIERREEPFEGALLPRALQERTWPISERRIRAWFDTRAKRSPDDVVGREGDHFRCRWFAPDNAATIRTVVPLFERGVVAVGSSFGETVRRWLDDADACFDSAIDEALDEVEPHHATQPRVVELDGVLDSLSWLLVVEESAQRERWIDALVERCPSTYELIWRWANERQRERILADVRRNGRAPHFRDLCPATDTIELAAACMDPWARRGCPLSRKVEPEFVAIRRHFADGRRDPARNAWQLKKDALRERLSRELEEGSLDWVIDPGPWWISAMFDDDQSSRGLLVSLYEQHVSLDESVADSGANTHPLERYLQPDEGVESADASSLEPRPEFVLGDRLETADYEDGMRLLREAYANRVGCHARVVTSWLARVAPEQLAHIGDRLIELLLAHHAVEHSELNAG